MKRLLALLPLVGFVIADPVVTIIIDTPTNIVVTAKVDAPTNCVVHIIMTNSVPVEVPLPPQPTNNCQGVAVFEAWRKRPLSVRERRIVPWAEIAAAWREQNKARGINLGLIEDLHVDASAGALFRRQHPNGN